MRRSVFSALALTLLLCGTSISQTTLANETGNNTSASSSFAGLTDFRTADANTSPALGSPILTNPFNIVPTNIALGRGTFGDVHNLMYPQFNGKIFVETQTWFCTPSNGTLQRDYSANNNHSFPICELHQMTQYNSNDSAHDNAAVDDMFNRGFDGFIADSSGDPNGCGFPNFTSSCSVFGPNRSVVDAAINNMRGRINSTYASTLQYAIMQDQSSFAGDCNSGTINATTHNQAECIERKMLHDIAYYNSTRTYFSDSTYLKIGSVPVLMTFVDEVDAPFSLTQCTATNTCTLVNNTCTSASDCWTKIWGAVAGQGVSLKLMFRNKGGFTHVNSSGGYAWVTADPTTSNTQITALTQENWDDDFSGQAHAINTSPTNSNYLGELYHIAECIRPGGTCAGETAFGVVYKGFDREDAGFVANPNLGHVIAQQCGQTWLNTFQKISGNDDKNNQPYFSSANQLPFVQVATWDDYDEGSEIETGIDNCVNANSFVTDTITTATNLTWQLSFSDTQFGTVNTFDHYTLFYTTDGTNLFDKLDVSATSPSCNNSTSPITCTVTLNQLAPWNRGTYTLYVKEQSKPSITNHMSSSVSFTPAPINITPSPIAFGTVAPGSTNPTTVTLTNGGGFNVLVSSASVNASQYAISAGTCAAFPFTLAPSASCTLTLTFNAPNVNNGSFPATFTVFHNGANDLSDTSQGGGSSASVSGSTSCGTGCNAPNILSISPTSGAPGTSVTITGSNFGSPQGTSVVNFGTTAASVTSWATGSITAIVPNLPTGAVNVQVIVNNVASNTVTFTVTCGSGTETTLSNIDDLSGWVQTSGSATSTLTQNVATPSLDGGSAKFSLTGGPAFSLAKWEKQLGAGVSTAPLELQLDVQVQIDTPANPQALEFGFSQVLNGSDYAFHFNCDFKDKKVWKVWNAALNTWSVTTIPCTPFAANTWVHLVFDVTRTSANQLQYNWLSINGTQSTINQTFNPNSEQPNNIEASVILYADGNASPYSVYVDSMTINEISGTCP